MLQEKANPRLENVRFELRATGIKAIPANFLRSGIHNRGYLPHVKREGSSYFVTFRLADSLPKEVILRIHQRKTVRLAQLTNRNYNKSASQSNTVHAIEREYFRAIEQYLDQNAGACWMKRPEIAEVVSTALRYFEGTRYLLKAWVVMPNHVHAVLWPMPNHTLSCIVRGWKGYTAREINKRLASIGQTFWQPEAYDHWIRNEIEHERCCRYVIYNPVKARLCKTPEDWPWSSAWRGNKS